MMNLSQLQGEEKLLLARLCDLAELCERRHSVKFSGFLNERQQMIAMELIRQRHLENTRLYGGYSDAVRRVAGFFPPHTVVDTACFPFTAVDILFKKDFALSHRDFLGSLMGLGLERESIGDFLIEPGLCRVFLLDPVDRLVMQELNKIGRVGVRCEPAGDKPLTREQEFDHIRGTVSSVRLDCLVSLLTNASREKSGQLLKGELVQRNYAVVQNGSRDFCVGDTITIRGYGKYIVDEIGAPTRKGRLPVLVRKYR